MIRYLSISQNPQIMNNISARYYNTLFRIEIDFSNIVTMNVFCSLYQYTFEISLDYCII